MLPPLCTCLELFVGQKLPWDAFGNYRCPHCNRPWMACARCQRAVLVGSSGVCLFCGTPPESP